MSNNDGGSDGLLGCREGVWLTGTLPLVPSLAAARNLVYLGTRWVRDAQTAGGMALCCVGPSVAVLREDSV